MVDKQQGIVSPLPSSAFIMAIRDCLVIFSSLPRSVITAFRPALVDFILLVVVACANAGSGISFYESAHGPEVL